MKKFFVLIALFSMISCNGQKKESKKLNKMTNDTIKIPNDATKFNLGFEDSPVWIWVKASEPLSTKNQKYDHVYGFDFWDKDGYIERRFYEQDRDLNQENIKEISSYKILRYPGDNTLKLIKSNDTLILFSVMENKDLSRDFKGLNFKRIPTTRLNKKNEKVSGFDVEINIQSEEGGLFLVTTIDSRGIKKAKYKTKCSNLKEHELSYLDRINNRIYFTGKDCFLEESK